MARGGYCEICILRNEAAGEKLGLEGADVESVRKRVLRIHRLAPFSRCVRVCARVLQRYPVGESYITIRYHDTHTRPIVRSLIYRLLGSRILLRNMAYSVYRLN